MSRKVWAAPGQSYYVCMLEGRAGGSSASCGHLIATTTANTGVKRHLEGQHPELLVAKQPNPATEGKTSNFQAVLAVLESGLPYNQFTVKSGSLRKLLPAFPSANTFRKYAREMVPITVANIKEALGRVSSIGVTFDFTPLPNRELAAVNVHLWGRHGPEVLTLAVQEMEGSLTSDAISTWLKKVADLYGIKLLTTTPTDDPAVLLWAGTDSGSNVVGAGKALVDPYVTYQSSLLPDFFGWSFCVAHGGNLLIHDALSHGFIGPLIETIVGHTKAIRHSRTLREAVVEQGIPTPGRLVTTRWRSLMRLIRYWVQNAAKLEAASDQFAIAPNDLNKLALVFGILEPVDLFIARSQADVAGDAFFIPIRVFGILAVYKKKQGFRKLVVDSTTTTPMVAADFDTSLSSWLGFVTEPFEERFLSTNTADFEVVDDGESDTDDDDECDDDDDVDEVDDGDNVEWRGPRARFKHQCLLMHSAVLAAFGLSPLGSAWGAGVAEGALTSEDARQLVDDANVDGVKQALLIRFMTDSDWRRAVRTGARAGGAGGATPAAGILGMLQGPHRVAANPIDSAATSIKNFVESDALKQLFVNYLQLAEDKRTPDVEKTFVVRWAELAHESAPWIGHVVRSILIAPLRSTGPESDFSIVQHIHGPRRQRISREVLAAYLLSKRARAYITEPRRDVGITKEGTKDITLFTAPKGAVPARATSSSGGAAVEASSSSSSSSAPQTSPAQAAPRRRRASDDDDDEEEEEPDLQANLVVTRSGRRAGAITTRQIADIITPDARLARRATGTARMV